MRCIFLRQQINGSEDKSGIIRLWRRCIALIFHVICVFVFSLVHLELDHWLFFFNLEHLSIFRARIFTLCERISSNSLAVLFFSEKLVSSIAYSIPSPPLWVDYCLQQQTLSKGRCTIEIEKDSTITQLALCLIMLGSKRTLIVPCKLTY